MPWRRSRLLQKYAKSADHAKSAIWTGPPCGPAAPMPSRRLPLPYFGFSCNFRSPCDSTASHTQAIFPYGIVVSPYNYTPDAFPHTLHQISIGRPSPHTFSADPPHNPQAPKNPNPNPERPASGAADPQPTLTNRYPGPASQSSKPSAGQVQQILQTCDWGWRRHARAHLQGHAHDHGHVRAHPYHGHAFTAMSTSLYRARLRQDQRPVHSNLRARPTHSNSLRRRGGHGHGVAWRCDDGVDDDDRGPVHVLSGLRARLWSGLKAGQMARLKACWYGPPKGGLCVPTTGCAHSYTPCPQGACQQAGTSNNANDGTDRIAD